MEGNGGPKPSWSLGDERELWADICREDFWWFLKIAWGADFYMEANENERWLTKRLHRPIARWLEGHVKEWEGWRREDAKRRKKLALIIPRSYGKTVMATKALTLWAQVRNPDLSSFIGSEVVTKAVDCLSPIKGVMDGSDPYAWFSWLYGVWYHPERLWTAWRVIHGARVNTARSEPSFDTWGVEQGITGKHPDWGAFDDPMSEEKLSESGQWIQTVNRAFAALRPAFRTDSFFVLSLTRYRDNDLAGTFLPSEGVKTWTGMARTDERMVPRENGEWDVYFLQAYDAAGESTFPEVWTTRELRAFESSRSVEFAAQMMNEPGSGEHMALTSEQIEQCYVPRAEVPRNLAVTIHLDTAFKQNDRRLKGDESVFEVWGHDLRGNGDVYYLEGYGSNAWRVEEFTDELIKVIQKLKREGRRVKLLTDEKEMGGKVGLWHNWLKSSFHGAGLVCPPIVVLSRAGVKKLTRMREAAGFWVDGHVKLVRDAPGVLKLVGQMIRLGVSSHDDWADAAADVFADEVYRPMLQIEASGSEVGSPSIQPGDDIIKGPISNEQARYIYDIAHNEWLTALDYEESWSQ